VRILEHFQQCGSRPARQNAASKKLELSSDSIGTEKALPESGTRFAHFAFASGVPAVHFASNLEPPRSALAGSGKARRSPTEEFRLRGPDNRKALGSSPFLS
jgi:hypothetical protein